MRWKAQSSRQYLFSRRQQHSRLGKSHWQHKYCPKTSTEPESRSDQLHTTSATMACPPEITVHNFNCSFDMNKKEGDDTSGMLKMQGLPWLVRQAASYSAVSINLKQFKGDDGIEHLDQEQVSTGGVKQLEPRLLNGEWGERDVQFWGLVKGQNK